MKPNKKKKSNIVMFLSLLLLALAIPATVVLTQYQKDIRQQADTSQATVTLSPTSGKPGDTVNVSWAIEETGIEGMQLTMTPTSITRGRQVTLSWGYENTTPNANDIFEVFTTSGEHVAYIYPNSCTSTPAANPPAATGNCAIDTTNYGPATYVVKAFHHDNRTTPTAVTRFIVYSGQGGGVACTYDQKSEAYSCQNGYICYNDYFRDHTTGCEWQPKRNNNGLWYHCDRSDMCSGNGERDRLNEANDRGPQGFLFIPKAYARTILTGAETIRLVSRNTEGSKVSQIGTSMYLNCQKTSTRDDNVPNVAPPATPLLTGACPFIIPDMVTSVNLSYIFQLVASDGQTVLGESALTMKGSEQGTSIGAHPNPCVLSEEGTCTTTIGWKSVSFPNVTLRVKASESNTPKPVAAGEYGHQLIPWITGNGAIFQLVSGETVIETLKVKGIPAQLSASPTTCVVNDQGTCSVTLSWNAHTASEVTVKIKETGGLFAADAQGSAVAPWITTQGVTFELYSGNTRLKSLRVVGTAR